MATVLIWMSPEAGHTIPSIKVAGDLLQQGHRVVYLTCGKIRQELAALGFETKAFFPAEWPELAARSIFGPCRPARHMYRALERRFRDSQGLAIGIRSAIQDAVVAVGADLVLADGVFDTWLQVHRSLENRCKAARLYVHLPYKPLPSEDVSVAGSPRIYLSPKQFELPERLCDDVYYTEPALYLGRYSTTDRFDWDALGSDLPIVYCSLGSQMALYSGVPQFFGDILTAAASLPELQFIVNAGALAGGLVPPPGAGNVKVVSFLPHPEVLPRAAVAVIHGGFGVIKECIYFGVPMLIVPQQWDQPLNAVRVAYHGVGSWMHASQTSAQAITESVRTLAADASVRSRIRELQLVFLASHGDQVTARVCSTLLQESCGTAREQIVR